MLAGDFPFNSYILQTNRERVVKFLKGGLTKLKKKKVARLKD